MSIRIGLYDFFAYTLPGVFYLLIIVFWLDKTGLVQIDLATLKKLSLLFLFFMLGAGYITGLLLDPLAYSWMRLFSGRNRDATKVAYNVFINRHKWVNLDFDATDWVILLRAVKSQSLEAAAEVEQHNVAAIMLRNISLALLFSSISCLIYFLFMNTNGWLLLFFLVFIELSVIAIRRSRIRRDWFYLGVFEAFTAHFLMDAKLNKGKVQEELTRSIPKTTRKGINASQHHDN